MSHHPTATEHAVCAHSTRPLLRAAFGLALLTLVAFGFFYSLASTWITAALFPRQAMGSMLYSHGQIVGSALVAQPFTAPGYFHSRPSACDYDPMKASGSNQARSNPDLRVRLLKTRHEVALRDHVAEESVASDLITQSASGLDPDISFAAAKEQEARVAKARGLTRERVHQLVLATMPAKTVDTDQSYVNVLTLNLALDRVVAELQK